MRAAEITERTERAAALERLFRLEGERLWRALLAFTGGRAALAEDALAEAFSRALAAGDDIRDPARWIYRVAMRVAIDEIRRERRPPRTRATPSVEAHEPSDDVWRALRALPPNQRMAAVMRYEMDLSVDEIARRMGIAAATVRVHLLRGRRRLRQLLEGDDDG